jgi:outer membrane protein assembly factor BamB
VKSDEFIREVDEELRRDRLTVLWRRYGALILGGAILIVAATAAKVGWDHWAEQARAAEAVRFAAAQQALLAADPAAAAAQFAALAAEGKTGFAALARLKEAEAKLGQKDAAGATAALDGLAARGAQGAAGAFGHGGRALAQPGPRAPGPPGDPHRCAGRGQGHPGRADPGGRCAAVAAAARGRAPAGDRWRAGPGQLMTALSRRGALTAAAALLAGCSEGTWLGETQAPPLPGERKSVLLIEDQLSADPRLAELNVTLPPAVRNADWPQVGGDPSHAMQHLEAADTIEVAWRADIGAGAGGGSRLLGGPVVGGGRVYGVDADGMTTAVDAATGTEAWQFAPDDVEEVDRLAGGGAAYDDGRLFVVTGNGMVYGLDAAGGAEAWRRQIKAPIRSAPTVAGGRVLVPTADGQLFALDAGSGELLWQHAGLFEQTGLLGGASPAVAGQIVIAAYASGEVVALTLDSGQQLWSDAVLRPRRTLAIGTIAGIVGDPVIAGDRVLVAGVSGEMAAFDLERGVREWTAEVTSIQTPWVAGNFIFVLTERNEVVCMVDQGGRIRWVTALPSLVDPENPDSRQIRWVGPILVSDRLLLASSEGAVVSVSPFTGEILGSGEVGGAVSVPAAVAGGTVFFLTDEAQLVAFR